MVGLKRSMHRQHQIRITRFQRRPRAHPGEAEEGGEGFVQMETVTETTETVDVVMEGGEAVEGLYGEGHESAATKIQVSEGPGEAER